MTAPKRTPKAPRVQLPRGLEAIRRKAVKIAVESERAAVAPGKKGAQ